MSEFTPLNNYLEVICFRNYIIEMYGHYVLKTSFLFNGVKKAIIFGGG